MFELIRANQRRTAFLVVAMAGLLLILGFALGELVEPGAGLAGLVVGLLLWVVLGLVAYYQGDSIFLSLAGARRIQKQDHPVLFNVVEEMCAASGLAQMPAVYIVDVDAPNAFATGRDSRTASVAVTAGLLERLDRDELQGVIAHELGHVKNRDILYLMMLGVMFGAIVILADIGRRVLWLGGGGRRRTSSKGGGGWIVIVALVLMILAPFFAQLLYFAVSRRREYLADASSAQFTRYPEGLASALEKISGLKPTGQPTAHDRAVAQFGERLDRIVDQPRSEVGRATSDALDAAPGVEPLAAPPLGRPFSPPAAPAPARLTPDDELASRLAKIADEGPPSWRSSRDEAPDSSDAETPDDRTSRGSVQRVMTPMYIVEPLGGGGGWLYSTHPPVQQRVAILRAMGGEASLARYQESFRTVTHRPVGLIPFSALQEEKTRPQARPPQPDGMTKLDRVRATTDLLWRLNQFIFVACPCGTKLKFPPAYAGQTLACPQCQRPHLVQPAPAA